VSGSRGITVLVLESTVPRTGGIQYSLYRYIGGGGTGGGGCAISLVYCPLYVYSLNRRRAVSVNQNDFSRYIRECASI
jgi:hypothetical protein